MEKYRIIFIAGFFFLFNSFCFKDDNNNFFSILKQAGLKFNKPSNTIEVPIINNDELNYEYALKDTVNNIEIRYLVYPLQQLVNHYNGAHADTGMERVDPNFIHTNLLLMYSYKMEGKQMSVDGSMPEIKGLPHATADLVFNADWAAEVDIQPCDEFAQKYKYCTILGLHKDNLADAFIIYLYNNKEAFTSSDPFGEKTTNADFHSLIFNK